MKLLLFICSGVWCTSEFLVWVQHSVCAWMVWVCCWLGSFVLRVCWVRFAVLLIFGWVICVVFLGWVCWLVVSVCLMRLI